MSGITSAKLYVQVAILRRRVLLHQQIRRVIAGALAVAALIVAAGLATYALYLAIRVSLGELQSVLAIAGGYFTVAVGLVFYTFHEPKSPELDALTEMEAATLEAALAENHDVLHAVTVAGQRIHDVGNSVSLGIAILSSLRALMQRRKDG